MMRARFWLCFVAFLLCINLNSGESKENRVNLNLINFDEIKSDLFLKSASKNSNEFIHSKSGSPMECSAQLDIIKKALLNSELWAIKMLDAWGKMPSTIFEGNLFEFGGFSECFHIERGEKLYETQYCLGRLIADFNGISGPKSSQFNFNNLDMQNILQTNDQVSPNTRMLLPPPEKGIAITFGVCLPASCPTDLIETLINNLLEQKVSNVSVQLLSNTCQFEENITEWRLIDNITIGVLGGVLFLVIASTLYDILCTIKQCKKSQALLAFSVYTNGRKLLSYKESKASEVMNCVHGIRVLSTQWVVMGHTYFMYLYLPTRNLAAMATFVSKYHNMVVLSAFISVDTFFTLSGLFVTISMLKHLEKTKGKMNVPLLYIHRYLRLTPIFVMSVLFSITLMRFLGNGPLWPSLMDFASGQCERNWWSTLLYIQNYVNPDEICFPHSWYLSVDFQLFLMAPPVVYLIYRFKLKTLPVWILFMLGSTGCMLATRDKYDLKGLLAGPDVTSKIYFPTHLRFSPWLIGIIAGYFFYQARNTTVRIPRVFNLFTWSVSLAIMGTVIFINYPLVQVDSTATPIEYGLYDAISRIAWAIALCYIIFACIHGYGGPINWFLAHPLWQPLSRLSFSIYLVHFPVILVTMATMKSSQYFSELDAIHVFLGNYVISVFVALIASLAFESPMIVIEKLIFGPKKKPQHTDKATQNGVQGIKTEGNPPKSNDSHS